MQMFPWHGICYHSKAHAGITSKTWQLCVCLSAVSARFPSSAAGEKLDFPVNFPQNCHFISWVPEIILWAWYVMEMAFDFHFPEKRRPGQKQHSSCSFHPPRSPCTPPGLTPSVSSFTFPALFFRLFLFYFSSSPLSCFSVIFCQSSPESCPAATRWAGLKATGNHHGGTRLVLSPAPCGRRQL